MKKISSPSLILTTLTLLISCAHAVECGAGLITNNQDDGKCVPCSFGSYKSEINSTCITCSAGFMCEPVPSVSINGTSVFNRVFDSGGEEGAYQSNERSYHQLNCSVPGTFMRFKINRVEFRKLSVCGQWQ